MTYPTVPLGTQWTHRALADDATMHARTDVPLNAAAHVLRAQPGSSGALIASMRNAAGTAAIAAGSVVVWDTPVLSDGAYNAATGVWTCPADGVYLMSVRLCQSGVSPTTVGGVLRGLNTGLYPSNSLFTNITGPTAGTQAALSAFPVICAAGEQYHIETTSGTWRPQSTASSFDRSQWTIQPLGKFYGPINAGSVPEVPDVLDGNVWVDGEPVNDLKLHRRFDQPMDALQPYLAAWGAQHCVFVGSRVGGTTAAGNDVAYDAEIDTGAGWDGASAYNVPFAGLWLFAAAIVSAGDVNVNFTMTTAGYPDLLSPTALAGGGTGKGASMAVVRPAQVGEQLRINSPAGVTHAATFRSYLVAIQLG